MTPYDYEGLSLTPVSIEKLILELFQGKIIQRKDLAAIVTKEHLARGGKKAGNKDASDSFYDALKRLERRGLSKHLNHGNWRILDDSSQTVAKQNSQEDALVESTFLPEPPVPEKENKGALYTYFYPTYREASVSKGETRWLCKIGITEKGVHSRVYDQVKVTGLPENPCIAVVIPLDNPRGLESAIHMALTGRGYKSETSPGTEWFMTNPDEVMEIVHYINPRLNNVISQEEAVLV